VVSAQTDGLRHKKQAMAERRKKKPFPLPVLEQKTDMRLLPV
jgi:hypothetical protein